MTCIITAKYIKQDVPTTGLIPTVYIYDLSDNSVVVSGSTMSEIALGGYKYTFALFDRIKNYFIVCDGGVTMAGYGRYSYGSSNSQGDIDFIKNMKGGRLKIDTSVTQMIYYEDDNITEIARFDLLNSSGVSSFTNVYERVRV